MRARCGGTRWKRRPNARPRRGAHGTHQAVETDSRCRATPQILRARGGGASPLALWRTSPRRRSTWLAADTRPPLPSSVVAVTMRLANLLLVAALLVAALLVILLVVPCRPLPVVAAPPPAEAKVKSRPGESKAPTIASSCVPSAMCVLRVPACGRPYEPLGLRSTASCCCGRPALRRDGCRKSEHGGDATKRRSLSFARAPCFTVLAHYTRGGCSRKQSTANVFEWGRRTSEYNRRCVQELMFDMFSVANMASG